MWNIAATKIDGASRPTERWLCLLSMLLFSCAMVSMPLPALATSPLMHSSDNLGTRYGAWGVTGGRYGQFTCATCHKEATSNIKLVAQTLTAPQGNWSSSKTSTVSVVFSNVTGFGNDATAHTSSTMVCQVCHTKTLVHRYNKPVTQVDANHQKANLTDCTQCHSHANAFAPSCNTCHGYPPNSATVGTNGQASPATNALQAGQVGAHVAHTNAPFNMTCETCHTGYTASPMGDNRIEIGFGINNANYPAFGSSSSNRGTWFGNSGIAAPYVWRASASGTAVSQSASAESCSVYCHGNWAGANGSVATPNWGITDGTQKACGSCHGASTAQPPTAGSHSRHAGIGSGGLSVACASCHGAVSNNTHVNGMVAWNLGGVAGAPTATYRSAASGATANVAPSASYGTCATLYCHSNVQGATGTGAPTLTSTPTWGGAALACNSCHGSPMATGSHTTHTSTYSFVCDTCHAGAGSATAKHADGHIDITMTQGKYSSAYPSGYKVSGSSAYSSCQNTICHAGAGTSPTWGNSGSVAANCQGCHGNEANAATKLSGVHNNHLNQATTGGAFKCADCHALTITSADNRTITNRVLHANGIINYSGARAGGSSTYSTATKSCATIYCHSNGKGVFVGMTGSKKWTGSANFQCNGCHGRSNSLGYPDYASGAAGSATANNHGKHVGAPYNIGCTTCHSTTVASNTTIKTGTTTHINGTPQDLAFSGISSAWKASYTAGTKGCSTVYCHSNGKGSYQAGLQWGQTDNCSFCHPIGSLSATHAKHIDTTLIPSFYSYTANRSSAATYNFGCSNCHPIVNANHTSGMVLLDFTPGASGVSSLRSKNSAAITAGGVVAGTVGSGTTGTPGTSVTCANVYCHSNGYAANLVYATTPNWYGGSFTGDKCANCHGNSPNVTIAGSASHSAHVVAMHYKDVYSGTNGLLKAGTNNAPHGNATESTTYNCNICHYATVTSSANDSNSVCVTCHYTGNTVGATLKGAATVANKTNHVNGKVEISFQSTSVISKAQLRQSSFTGATTVSNYWNRNGSTNYKNGATAFDTSKSALANTMWASGGTCSTTACHNGRSVNWYNDAGKAAQCIMCHTGL